MSSILENLIYIAVGGVFTVLWQLIKWMRGGAKKRMKNVRAMASENAKAIDRLQENAVSHSELRAVEQRLEARIERSEKHFDNRIDRTETVMTDRMKLVEKNVTREVRFIASLLSDDETTSFRDPPDGPPYDERD